MRNCLSRKMRSWCSGRMEARKCLSWMVAKALLLGEPATAAVVTVCRGRLGSGRDSYSPTDTREPVATNVLLASTIPPAPKKRGGACTGTAMRAALASLFADSAAFFLVEGPLWNDGLELHFIFKHSQGLSRTKLTLANDDSSPLRRLLILRNPQRLSFRMKL